MDIVSSEAHRAHDPAFEVDYGDRVAMFEVPARADAILAELRGDPAFDLVAPTDHGRDPIDAVHEPRLVDFLGDAWARFQADVQPAAEVFPDVMLHPALVDGMGPGTEPDHVAGQLGYWCWETNTPLAAGTYAAARAAVDVALTALDRVDAGDQAYGLCRPPGHQRAAPRTAGTASSTTPRWLPRKPADEAGARSPCSTSTTTTATAPSRSSGTGPTSCTPRSTATPGAAYPYFVGHADETGHGAGAGTTLNLPLPAGVADDAYLVALERAVEALDAYGSELVVVSLGLDTSIGDPLGDFALTADGMTRCGALVAGLACDTIVLQEGGYDLDTIGRDAHAWLNGFLSV